MVISTLKMADDYKNTTVLPAEEWATRDAMYKTIGGQGLAKYRSANVTRSLETKTDYTVRIVTGKPVVFL